MFCMGSLNISASAIITIVLKYYGDIKKNYNVPNS